MGRRTASIRVRQRAKGRVYEARYRDVNGRLRGKSFATEAQAKAFLDEMRVAVRQRTWADPAKQRERWSAIAERWLANLNPHKVKPRTVDGYRRLLADERWFGPWAERQIGSLTTEDVEALLARLSAAGKSIQTQHNVFGVAQAVFTYAVRHNVITTNPAREMRDALPSRTRRSHRPRFLTAAEVNSLAAACPTPFDDLVLFAAWSGLRWGELCALRLRHVDPLRGSVRVEETWAPGYGFGTPKSTNSRRVVPIAPTLARLVTDNATVRGVRADDLVWTMNGKPLSHSVFTRRVWTPARAAADVGDVRWHDLRHTFAALMAGQGRSVAEVSKWMGHNSAGFTIDVYMRQNHVWTDEAVADALDAGFAAGRAAVAPVAKVRSLGT